MGRMGREDLEDRRFYKIKSRNIRVGVWSRRTGTFIGIRESFGSDLLDSEYLYGPDWGTAVPIEPLDVFVPEDIPLKEVLEPVCTECGDKTFQVWEDDPKFPSGRRCVGNKHYTNYGCILEGTFMSVLPPNKSLYNMCKEVENSLT